MQRIEKTLERLSVKYEINDKDAYVEFWTDTAGQDICVDLEYDGTPQDFVKQFEEYAENYDVDDEVEQYAGLRGTNGVPSSFRTLVADCEEAKKTLNEIAAALGQALKPQPKRRDTTYICPICGHEFTSVIDHDKLGWHAACPKCKGRFDVEVPSGRYVIAFTDKTNGFTDSRKGQNVVSYFAAENELDFLELWDSLFNENVFELGFWCWVFDLKDSTHSVKIAGPCIPDDIRVFRSWNELMDNAVTYFLQKEKRKKVSVCKEIGESIDTALQLCHQNTRILAKSGMTDKLKEIKRQIKNIKGE